MSGLNGKAEPFREANTGSGAVPNNDGLVAALLRCAACEISVALVVNPCRPFSHGAENTKELRVTPKYLLMSLLAGLSAIKTLSIIDELPKSEAEQSIRGHRSI